jgi:cell division protein FtsL
MKDVYFIQQIDNSHLVRFADPNRKRDQRLIGGGLALVFFLLFAYAWQNYQLVRLGYQLEQVRDKEAGLNDWNRALRLEEASLRDPTRVYEVAQHRLGLETARAEQVVPINLGPNDAGPVLAEARSLRTTQ